MTLSAALAPLLRALTGGRYPRRRSARTARSSLLGRDWAELLGPLQLSPGVLREVLTAGSLHPHFHYRHFTRPKKGGGRREIVEPDDRLAGLQRAILARYLEVEPPHPAAIAYRKKRSIADHVWAHAGAELLVSADVEDFFPSTRVGRVEDWWHLRVGGELARLLTLLTTYRGGLPQGAPTSPALSNLVNREMDEQLASRATAAGARYTRYCDDMVFSWRHDATLPADFENGVRAALHAFGYRLHPSKGWCVHTRRDEPEITGVILTRHGGVRLPPRVREQMRNLRRRDDPLSAERLAGYRGYEAMIRKRPRR